MRNFIGALAILIAIGLFVYCGVAEWMLGRDTNSLLERAQVAADAGVMLEYVEQLEENMVEHGMTHGHAAVIFKTPSNDMSLVFNSVQNARTRLVEVKDLPKDSTTYNVALDDLRGTLRELDLHTGGWFWTIRGWWMSLIAAIVLFVALGCFVKV